MKLISPAIYFCINISFFAKLTQMLNRLSLPLRRHCDVVFSEIRIGLVPKLKMYFKIFFFYVVKKDFNILRVPATIRIEVVQIESKNKFRVL